MAIIPEALATVETEFLDITPTIEPSKTYALLNGRIGGNIDGEEAIKQFISKAIRTVRNRFLIYNDEYGSELENLIGANITRELLEEEIPRVVTETLIYDDRIASVNNFVVTYIGDKVFIQFSVTLTTGQTVESEVTV
ncbi:DUF2634 domain-containing protein [Paenisporosarcina sp. NPDC076898]|uniref:DUF2634 domain-containing protein n=1 Tax=unclassified Paenisporosarcina TaxID=2642018 RepID=UPI003D03A4D1